MLDAHDVSRTPLVHRYVYNTHEIRGGYLNSKSLTNTTVVVILANIMSLDTSH